jgi:hypothetical protein
MTNLLTKIGALGALVLLLGASHSLAADAQVKDRQFHLRSAHAYGQSRHHGDLGQR